MHSSRILTTRLSTCFFVRQQTVCALIFRPFPRDLASQCITGNMLLHLMSQCQCCCRIFGEWKVTSVLTKFGLLCFLLMGQPILGEKPLISNDLQTYTNSYMSTTNPHINKHIGGTDSCIVSTIYLHCSFRLCNHNNSRVFIKNVPFIRTRRQMQLAIIPSNITNGCLLLPPGLLWNLQMPLLCQFADIVVSCICLALPGQEK